jgi:hypothetical protein
VIIDRSLVRSSSTDADSGDKTAMIHQDKGDLRISPPPITTEESSSSLEENNPDVINNSKYEYSCAICLTEYVEGDEICWSPSNDDCHHVFHRQCILEWLYRHDECPCCRNDFLPDLSEELRMTTTTRSSGTTTTTLQPDTDHDDLIHALQQLHRQFPHGAPPAMQAEILRSLFDLYFPRVMTMQNDGRQQQQRDDTMGQRRYESGFYLDDGVALEVNDDDDNDEEQIVVLGDQDIVLDMADEEEEDDEPPQAISISSNADETEGDIEMGSTRQQLSIPEAESIRDDVVEEQEDVAKTRKYRAKREVSRYFASGARAPKYLGVHPRPRAPQVSVPSTMRFGQVSAAVARLR